MVISDFRYYYTNVISAWTTKAGLLIQGLANQGFEELHYLLLSLRACTKKHLEELFKEMQNQSLKTLKTLALLCKVN